MGPLPVVRRFTLGLFLIAATVTHLDAQRRLPPGAGFIGRVVDAAGTGRGVDRALVTITNGRVRRQILTDTRGRFLLTGLPDGEYQLTATRHGFLDGAYGQRRSGGSSTTITVIAGQWIADIDVPVWRPAIITGTVIDAHGDVLEGIRVQAFRRTYVDGRATLALVATDTTDDTGGYRLAPLHAEDHVVRLTLGTHQYYPLATRPSHAIVITPDAGRETAGINFFVPTRETTHVVQGLVKSENDTDEPPRELRLAEPIDPDARLSDDDRTITRVVIDEEQRFVVEDVAPGDYSLEVDQSGGLRIRESITVDANPPPDPLVLALHALPDPLVPEPPALTGVRPSAVSGLVRGPTGQPDSDAVVVIFPAAMAARLTPRLFSARVSRFGHYSVTDLPPGNYLIAAIDDAQSAGWQAPDRLQALRRGASALTLKPGETKIVELKRLNLAR